MKEQNEIKYTAKNDKVFKAIVLKENNFEVLEAIISEAMGEDVKIIKYLLPELKVRNVKERTKRLDVLVEAKNALYNVELNTGTGVAMRVRNFNFFTAFYSQNTISGNKYEINTKFIHIDLSYNMSQKRPIKNVYKLRGEEPNNLYIDNFEVIEINMDKLKSAWYDNDEKTIEAYKHLIMLDMKSVNELEQLSEGDKIVETFKDEVVNLNRNYTFVRSITPEEDEILLANTEKYIARETGLAEGRAKGRSEGRAEGQKLELKRIVLEMLKNNLDMESITKYTGLTKEQVKNMKNESNH